MNSLLKICLFHFFINPGVSNRNTNMLGEVAWGSLFALSLLGQYIVFVFLTIWLYGVWTMHHHTNKLTLQFWNLQQLKFFTIEKCLEDANMYRLKHINTPLLQWDPVLASRAQAYAEKLKAKALRSGYVPIIHDPENSKLKMGENLWQYPYKEVGNMSMYCKRADKSW